GGEAPNVIPTRVELRGTIRSLHPEIRKELPGLVETTVARIASSHGATHSVEYRHGVPPVVNDPGVADVFARAARSARGDDSGVAVVCARAVRSAVGADARVPTETSMGGEEFAYYLDRVPGAMFRLGVACGGGDIHSAGFRLDDGALAVGMTAGMAAMVSLTRG